MIRIAIASGKGGTGKTTISTSLVYVLAEQGKSVSLLDCDVEEPNCQLFTRHKIDETKVVNLPVPLIDDEICDLCGTCVELCEFNALALLGDKVLVFPDLCHGCGGCTLFCPQKAISEVGREIGVTEQGNNEESSLIQGRLKIGESQAVPLIDAVKSAEFSEEIVIIDSPPGTACPVIAATQNVDFVVLVTEPTPFGLNDLRLAVEMIRVLKLPFGVVINRSNIGDNRVVDYCASENIKVLAEIEDDRSVAEVYSRGVIPAKLLPKYKEVFTDLAKTIFAEITNNSTK